MIRNNIRTRKHSKPPIPEYFKENYVIPKDYTTEYIILGLVLILVIGAWVVIFHYSKNKPIQNPTTKNLSDVSGDPSTGMANFYNQGADIGTLTVYEACDIGDCPTNVYTGEKRCPQNPSIQLLYNPITEVCNPQYSCTDPSTPYAILFDGSTDFGGNCDADFICRCTSTLTTPNYIQSLFTVTNGSILENNPQLYNTWYLTQTSSQVSGQGVNIPITYSDPSNNFYQLSYSLLTYITPSACDQIIENYIVKTTGSGSQVLPGDELPVNIGLECINSNPCIQGAFAYTQPYSFNTSQSNYTQFDVFNDFDIIPLSCVPDSFENRICTNGTFSSCNTWENRCEIEQAPVFNYATGRIHCVNPSPIINDQTATGPVPSGSSTAPTQHVQVLIVNKTTNPPPYHPPYNPPLPPPPPHVMYKSSKDNILVYDLTTGADYDFYLDVTEPFTLPTTFPTFSYALYYQWVKIDSNNILHPLNPGTNPTIQPPILPASLYAESIYPTNSQVSNITGTSGTIFLTTSTGLSTLTMRISGLKIVNGGNYACLLTMWSRYNDAAKTVMTNIISINPVSS
jgi:hypothetical protein